MEWLTAANISDPNITSNEGNLISLCKDCHFAIHRDQKIVGIKNKNKKTDTDNNFSFDENGYLIKTIPPVV